MRKTTSIRAMIWDFGGVLLRTEDPAPRSQLAARFGLTRRQLEDYVFHSEIGHRAQLGEISSEELWDAVGSIFGLDTEGKGELQLAFWAGDRLDDKLIGSIRSFRNMYSIALLSNAWTDLRQTIREKWKVDDIFDQLIISAEVGLMKPDARIYHLALERLSVHPAQVVFVDDFTENVTAAQSLGIHAIHFQYRNQALEEIHSLLERDIEG